MEPIKLDVSVDRRVAVGDGGARVVADPDLTGLAAYVSETDRLLAAMTTLAAAEAIAVDSAALELVEEVNALVHRLCAAPVVTGVVEHEQRVRAGTQLAAAARLAFEWRSPAYSQASVLAAMDVEALRARGDNYARYAQPGLGEIEEMLVGVLGLDPAHSSVLVTSSGMAGLTLLLGLLQHQDAMGRVLVAPGLYFESFELIDMLAGELHEADGYGYGELADRAHATAATAVFADPLANHPTLRMVDVERLAARLSELPEPPLLVVDGTMLPIVTLAPAIGSLSERVLYYESCSKYLQLGLDMAMAGFVVVPRSLERVARILRRDMGLILDRYGCECFPRFEADDLAARLDAMDAAARRLAAALEAAVPSGWAVAFPGLARHPDHVLAERFGRSGSCITLYPARGTATRDRLEPIVDAAIELARRIRFPLVKGASYGFTASRISVAHGFVDLVSGDRGEQAPPFVRIAVGPIGGDADRLAWAVLGALAVRSESHSVGN